MPFTDKSGAVWPDTKNYNGVNLILDPVASASSGRPKYRADPKQREQWAQQYGFVEKPQQQPGPMQGLALIGGGTAAAVLGNQLGSKIGSALGSSTTSASTGASAANAANTASSGLSPIGQQVLANQAGQSAATNLASLSGSGAPAVPTGLSGQVVSTGGNAATAADAAATPLGYAPYLGLAGAGLGGYGLYNAIKARDTKSGALSGAALGGGLAAAAPLLGLATGPVGWGALALSALGGGAGGAALTKLLGHESTADAEARRWGGLTEAAQGLFSANHPTSETGTWDTGKYAGQKWTFEKAADLASQDPTHFQGVYGNLSALGDGGTKYLALSDAQQKAFVKKNLEAGNYASNKGDVILKDHDLAQQIYDQVLQTNTASNKKSRGQSLAQAGVPSSKKLNR